METKPTEIRISDITPNGMIPSVTSDPWIYASVVEAINNGGKLPDELADLITLTAHVVNGRTYWVVDWFEI